MNQSDPKISLGVVHGDHSEVDAALSEFTEQKVGRSNVYGLAGPNDLVQIVADIPGWKIIGAAVVATYFKALIGEIAKDHWKEYGPKIKQVPAALEEKFVKLANALKKESENEWPVSIGLTEPVFCMFDRNDRIVIHDLSPEELARNLYIFSHCAQPVSEWLSGVYAVQKDKYHVAVSMRITDRIVGESLGTLVVELDAGSEERLRECGGVSRRVYDQYGKVIDETRVS